MITIKSGRYTKENKYVLLNALISAKGSVCDEAHIENHYCVCDYCPTKYKRVCTDLSLAIHHVEKSVDKVENLQIYDEIGDIGPIISAEFIDGITDC